MWRHLRAKNRQHQKIQKHTIVWYTKFYLYHAKIQLKRLTIENLVERDDLLMTAHPPCSVSSARAFSREFKQSRIRAIWLVFLVDRRGIFYETKLKKNIEQWHSFGKWARPCENYNCVSVFLLVIKISQSAHEVWFSVIVKFVLWGLRDVTKQWKKKWTILLDKRTNRDLFYFRVKFVVLLNRENELQYC